MRITLVVTLLLVQLFLIPSVFSQPVYTKGASLPPLRVSYEALESTLDKAASLITAANREYTTKPFIEKVYILDGNIQIMIPSRHLKSSGTKLPKSAGKFRYTVTSYPNELVPIRSLSMDFGDFERTIIIEGSSSEQVDAIFAAVKQDFEELSSSFGGYVFRANAGMLVFFICLGAGAVSLFLWSGKRDWRYLIPLGMSGLSLILLFCLPFSTVLAGFMVMQGDPSFASKYASEISLVALIVSIIGIPLTMLPSLIKPRVIQPSLAPVDIQAGSDPFSVSSNFTVIPVKESNVDAILGGLRTQRRLRALETLESGHKIASTVRQTYFYTGYWEIAKHSDGKVLDLQAATTRRFKTSKGYFEIHYLETGEPIIIGFTSASDAARIAGSAQEAHKICIVSFPCGEMTSLVSLPSNFILSAQNRTLYLTEDKSIEALDVELQATRNT